MASQRQHRLGRILDVSGPGTYNEEAGCWHQSGWSFFGFKAKTVEDAEEHLQRWASAILKKDAKAAQSEQKWFNDNGWTALEMKGSPPFYSRMVWKSSKLKKKIGVSIANGTSSLDPPANI
jgi:hypothetical protein